MKKHKDNNRVVGGITKRNKNQKAGNSGPQINDLLRVCLEKVCELQQELQREDDYGEDPQAAGYAACAVETLKFLAKEGLPPDHPMVKILTEKLVGNQ